jgi:hypothetical protein
MSEPIHDTAWAITTAARLARENEQARIIKLLESELVSFCRCLACRRTEQLIDIIKKEVSS